jgi:hypothetical protein
VPHRGGSPPSIHAEPSPGLAEEQVRLADELSDKLGQLEERAKRLALEEAAELRRGRELNIITK